jgi:DNA-binding PadR family transcriptional regulator
MYKQNLANLNRRYGDLERWVLELFARNPDRDDIWILDNMEILLVYLLEDGIIRPTGLVEEIKEKSLSKKQYQLTEKGRESIGRWFRPEHSDAWRKRSREDEMAKDQEFVVYNGTTMIAGWSEQIEAAQQVTTVSIGEKEVGRVRYGDERND